MKKECISLLLLLGMVFAGCSSPKVVQTTPPEQQLQPQQSEATAKEPERKITEIRPTDRMTEQQLAKIVTKEELPQYKEMSGLFQDIYFNFDEYQIQPGAKPVLEQVSSWMLKNSSAKISVEGNCDERGTNEYNLALGDKRAKGVRDYLIALGIAPDRIQTISYGEEKPVCTEATEQCWAKNRRAHFVVLREGDR
jgi:peptidoglycan-associated lipoprotein